MKRVIVLVALMAAMSLFASSVYADWELVGDRYHSNPGNCAALTGVGVDPTWLNPGWNWPGSPAGPPWIKDAVNPLPLPLAVNPGDCILLGKENLDQTWIKYIRIRVTYAGGNLDLDEAVWGTRPNARVTTGSPAPAPYTKSDVGGVLTLEWNVDQPDWEYVRLKNVGGAAALITAVDFYTKCNPVPSLTEWGLIALGALILAAGAMVIIRRRKAVATA